MSQVAPEISSDIEQRSRAAGITLEERFGLVLATARVLFVNGQSTEQTVAAGQRLGVVLGLGTRIMPRWGELLVQVEDGDGSVSRVVVAEPAGVNMTRVASAMRMLEDLETGKTNPAGASEAMGSISRLLPAPTWLFTLAAAAGAVALAVIFGVHHLPATVLILISAALGAVLRRCLARYSYNLLLQPFSASLLAGVVGALAVRLQLSSSLRLVAVCPCMILVPGPHVLNAAMDLIRGRISLGAARLLYAGLIVLAISVGLLLGMAILGVSLPVDPAGRAVPFWQDIIAAGVAVAAFSVFFSTPLYMFLWPVAVGTIAHGLRWLAISSLGLSAPIGAFIACLIVGMVLAPVSRRHQMPFAAVGFAAVVSMMPGVFLFRTASGLLQLLDASHATLNLISATLADMMIAGAIIVAMSIGLVIPKLAIDRLWQRPTHASS
jgi:uncharacterized membrane protein YjjP (DUF1212 family)